MDGSRFDGIARSIVRSRRALLGATLAGSAGRLFPSVIEARRRRKKRKKKSKIGKPNAFGCLNVGDVCRSADQCCSGICLGRKGRKRCRAHDSTSCEAGSAPEGCGGDDDLCTSSAGALGTCATTTGNAAYCAVGGDCFACKTDADCQSMLGGILGPNAACIQCADCADAGGTACVAPFISMVMGGGFRARAS